MNNIILPTNCSLIEESDLKSIEGGCLQDIISVVSSLASGTFSLNDLFGLVNTGMSLINTVTGGGGLTSLFSGLTSGGDLGSIVSGLLGSIVSSLFGSSTSTSATTTSC